MEKEFHITHISNPVVVEDHPDWYILILNLGYTDNNAKRK